MTEISSKRLVADRYRRIWHIVQEIASAPWHSRRELADLFHLSERQLQADAKIIRGELRLPLIRRGGYRFIAEGGSSGSGGLTLQDGVVLMQMFDRARRDRAIDAEMLAGLRTKIAMLFPPHLAPLMQALASELGGRQTGPSVLLALADAVLHGHLVRLDAYAHALRPWGPQATVRPSLLLPRLGRWYVISEDASTSRQRMIVLDEISAVTVDAVSAASTGARR
jgi:predicted DNA-binding transcriptional regulator YafY